VGQYGNKSQRRKIAKKGGENHHQKKDLHNDQGRTSKCSPILLGANNGRLKGSQEKGRIMSPASAQETPFFGEGVRHLGTVTWGTSAPKNHLPRKKGCSQDHKMSKKNAPAKKKSDDSPWGIKGFP